VRAALIGPVVALLTPLAHASAPALAAVLLIVAVLRVVRPHSTNQR